MVDPNYSQKETLLRQALAIIVTLGVVALGLGATLFYSWFLRPPIDLEQALKIDPSLKGHVIRELTEQTHTFYDSHVDSDVGRTLTSNFSDSADGILTTTNRFGMREREYTNPKPDGTVRIVLLGDSFIFGLGVAQSDRLGVFLEQELKERSNYEGEIEVLHLGVPSWTFTNQSHFLRRQLSELKPDVVLQLSLPNDIEDGVGPRGVGVFGRYSPQLPRRADSILNAGFPVSVLGFNRPGYVRHAIDYEGRQRYKEAVELLSDLKRRVDSVGGKYRLLLHFRQLNTPGKHMIADQMPQGSTHIIGRRFGNNRDYWLSKSDHHWNRAGHKRMGYALYELIRLEQLLPSLELPVWQQAIDDYEAIIEAGHLETRRADRPPSELLRTLGTPELTSKINFAQLDDWTAAQIHTGIDTEQLVSPYASFVLANNQREFLRVKGQTIAKPEIYGALVKIFVDEKLVGEMQITDGRDFDLKLNVPSELRDLSHLSIRFESDDYFYQGLDYQHCVVFKLNSIELTN